MTDIHDFAEKMLYNEDGDLNVICDIWNRKVSYGSETAETEKTVSVQ